MADGASADGRKPRKPPAVQATEYLIRLDRRHEEERTELEASLRRKYAAAADTVLRKVGVSSRTSATAGRPALSAAAALIGRFPAEAQLKILDALPLAARDEILSLLLNLEALFHLEPIPLQLVLRSIPRKVLAVALTGAFDGTMEAVYENLSSAAAAMLRDEREYAAEASDEEVRGARGQVAEIMRELYRAGDIPLPSPDSPSTGD